MFDNFEGWTTRIGAVLAAVVAIFVALRGTAALIGRMQHFLDDWFGEEARDGKPKTPGVMERLEALEDRKVTVCVGCPLVEDHDHGDTSL